MLINEEVKAVLSRESSAALVTVGVDGPHLVATWNSYIEVLDNDSFAFPAGGFHQTQANIAKGSHVEMIIGSRDESGKGMGFRMAGRAEFQVDTPVHQRLKERFPWCRAAAVVKFEEVEKVLG